jgi:hypothetical protein
MIKMVEDSVKLVAYYLHKSQNYDGHYGEDNPDADYPNEVYFPPTWSSSLLKETFDAKNVQLIFDREDGDEDFSHTLYLITIKCNSLDNEEFMGERVVFDVNSFKTREDVENAKKRIIEFYKVGDD